MTQRPYPGHDGLRARNRRLLYLLLGIGLGLFVVSFLYVGLFRSG